MRVNPIMMMRVNPLTTMLKSLKKKRLLLQMTYQCLTVYIKAFQMLVLLNLMSPSLSTTCVIAMTILRLIAEKRPMIPTIVSCMHLNFNYIYIYSHYCSNYCCIINSFPHCTNYFILILGRFVTDMDGETSGSRGRGRGHALPPLALRRSLLESISSPPPSTDEPPRGRGGRKKTGRGKVGGGRGKGRRTPAAASSRHLRLIHQNTAGWIPPRTLRSTRLSWRRRL